MHGTIPTAGRGPDAPLPTTPSSVHQGRLLPTRRNEMFSSFFLKKQRISRFAAVLVHIQTASTGHQFLLEAKIIFLLLFIIIIDRRDCWSPERTCYSRQTA